MPLLPSLSARHRLDGVHHSSKRVSRYISHCGCGGQLSLLRHRGGYSHVLGAGDIWAGEGGRGCAVVLWRVPSPACLSVWGCTVSVCVMCVCVYLYVWLCLQLGGGNFANALSPTLTTPEVAGAAEISAGLDFTCALSAGNVMCWGANACVSTQSVSAHPCPPHPCPCFRARPRAASFLPGLPLPPPVACVFPCSCVTVCP